MDGRGAGFGFQPAAFSKNGSESLQNATKDDAVKSDEST